MKWVIGLEFNGAYVDLYQFNIGFFNCLKANLFECYFQTVAIFSHNNTSTKFRVPYPAARFFVAIVSILFCLWLLGCIEKLCLDPK